ncbi:hypothetical protein F4825DRAFT_425246 [Nemania diffusa]|nr:hypothetical protein F4825DRAFT_425246 [Nemania diffusa]
MSALLYVLLRTLGLRACAGRYRLSPPSKRTRFATWDGQDGGPSHKSSQLGSQKDVGNTVYLPSEPLSNFS